MIPAAEQSMDQQAPMLPFPPSAGSSNNNDDCEMLPIPFSANERPHLLGHSPALLTFDAPHYQPICSTGSPGPNAPPPSACGTASDHSGSACPSPGPIKRFRQIYGDHQLLQQHQSGPTSSSSCSPAIQQNAVINKKPAMNWTENWMSAHYQFSRPGTSTSASSLLKCQQSSQTPSIMSTGSMISQISAISVDTQLSVAVDLLNLEQPNFVPAQLPDISSVTSNSTFIENVDPCYFQQMQYYLTQILEHLASMDENREFDAVCQLYRIGKDGQFMYCSESAQMMQVVQRLVEITLRPNTKQRTKTLTLNVLSKIAMAGNICLSAIRSLETADRGYFLNAIVLCLRSETEDDSRYATNILSVLFTHPTMGEFFRRQMRTQAVIRELMLALQQENYGFRHKFLRHIYYLIKPSRELKRFVHLSNGMQTCLEIFQRSVDERMLHGCSALILLLIDGLGRTAADHFVSTHGIQILATRLDHGSPRLLQCIARCLAASSDSDQIAHQSMDDAIRLCIQLLASTDADLVRHVVGFIANVQTKHRGAKEFLQRNKAIPNLMFLLSVWVDSKPSLAAGHKCGEEEETGGSTAGSCKHITLQKTGIDDIIDTVLLALNNLSNGVNADPAVTCQAIMELPNAHLLFLQLLASPNRPEIVYNRTLTLLGRILSSLPAAIGTAVLERLMYASVTKEGQQQQGYAHILLEIFFNACSKICAQQKADKEVKTMAFRSLYVLNELIKYPFFLGTTASLISAQNWNPFWLLGSLRDEELETAYMQFLYLLSASPDILAQWAFYEETLRVYTKIPHLSVLAVKIFNRIHKCIVNHHHNNCNINSKDNAFNVNNTG